MTDEIKDNFRQNLIISTIVVLIFAIFSISLNKKENYADTLKETISFMGGSFLMSTVTNKPLKYFISSIEPYIPTFINPNKNFIKINNYKKIYEKLKHRLTPHNNKVFIHRINKLLFFSSSDQTVFDNLAELIDFMIVLEGVSPNNTDVKTTVEKIESFLTTIQSNVVEELKEKIFKPFICNSVFKENVIPLSPIYLVGEKGVGKTRFIQSLSKLLEIPIVELKHDLNAFNREIWIGDKLSKEYLDVYTNLVYNSKINDASSSILYIDELDKKIKNDVKMIPFLLEIIHTNKVIHMDSYINYEVDIKNIILICCGNMSISDVLKDNEKTGLTALSDRFVNIKFPNIESDLKKSIIMKYIEEKCPNFNFNKYNDEIEKIVSEDTEPGLRKLYANINIFINKYSKYSIFEDTVWENN